MELRHLHYLVTLGETLHFGRAAERLHISQPPLSRQIALLEEELGVGLFDRTSRTVKLTAAGEGFLQDAKEILASVERAKRNAISANLGHRGSLSLGFMFAAAFSIAPAILRAYTTEYPEVHLHVGEAVPSLLIQDLRESRLDVGLMYPPGEMAGMETLTVFEEPLVAALPLNHPLSGSDDPIDAVDLKDEQFLITRREASPYFHDTIINHCKTEGFVPKTFLETNYQHTLITFVGQGLGVALVHRSMQTSLPTNVKFRPLRNPPTVKLNATWNSRNRNPCTDTFVQLAAKLGPTMHPGE
ncbi:LysR family transcriptional regulator [Paraburkholderia phymatum]|uniref:Transcriptional regulator, LysR family n=1 Tax=Paraburkholderia phymatum (strain DSM 17167 / CIP 108236 / LMG 21445 / STM815) TaxID=391038 RepID=B2JSK1_PARP8|nr:LysR family transcriptional regulator [Paraburkholderia phymatum]ACC74021.1 transcriptional regulator, LysR family [Paraburkholderia phymatum STM815]